MALSRRESHSHHDSLQIYEQGPFSTSLVLVDAVLTGITVQPASSPTACYNLPIPTSALDLIAFSADQTSPDDAHQNDPVFFYLSDNATVPEYVATLIDGNRYVLDVSSNASAASRIALTLSGGESLVIDQTGMHYFDARCGSGSSVLVDGFLGQILPMVNEAPQRMSGRQLDKREMPMTNFTVVVQVEDVIGSQFQGPQVLFGPTPCNFVNRNDTEGWSTYAWSCQHPGLNSSEKQCEGSFQTWLRPNTQPPSAGGQPPGTNGQPSSYLLKFISKAGSSITNLFPALSPPFAKGLNWLSKAESAVVDIAEFGGESICQLLHMNDEYLLVLSDPGISSAHTIGAYVSPPVPVISETMASHTTRNPRDPPRVVQPGATGFPTLTATAFLPTIFGPLLSIFGHGEAAGVAMTGAVPTSSVEVVTVFVPTVTVTDT